MSAWPMSRRGPSAPASVGSSPSAFPSVGAAISGIGLRVLGAAVGIALSWVVLPSQPAVLASIVSVLAVAFPRALLAWVLMVVLAVGLLAEGTPTAGDLRFHLVLAGIPLLHLLAVWTVEVPVLARVQLRVLARPGLRYLEVQVVCQTVATALLWAFAPGRRTFPVLVVVALAAAVGVAVVVVRALRGASVDG